MLVYQRVVKKKLPADLEDWKAAAFACLYGALFCTEKMAGQISSRPISTSPWPQKGSCLEGKWDPENFREM